MKQVEVKMINNPMPNNINIGKDSKDVGGANAENTAKADKKTTQKCKTLSNNKVLEFSDNIMMKTMCRPSIIFIQFFNLLLAFSLFFTWYLFTSFVTWQRPFTIIFLIFSAGFFVTFCYAFRNAKRMTDTILFAAAEKDKIKKVYVRKKSGNNAFLDLIKYESIMNFYVKYFYMEGDYYLVKLNVSELMEHVNQLINIFTIYNCEMRVEFVWVIFVVLTLESLHNALNLFRGKITTETRDHQALIDLLVDFFCVAFPLIVLYFIIELPITVPTMLQIMFLPTFGIYVKLKALQRQFILKDLRSIRYDAEKRMSMSASRRRMSLYGAKHEDVVIKRQMTFFTRPMQICFALINGLFGVFMIGLLVLQIVQLKTGDKECATRDARLWSHCVTKVPYCGTVIAPSCNCLILSLGGYGGSHNYTELPYKNNGMMNKMSALSMIQAENGPLMKLPGNFCEIHPNMKLMLFRKNRLRKINLDKCQNLIHIALQMNNIENIPNVVSSKESLLRLYLEHNRITTIPTWMAEMYILNAFSIFDNNISDIPDSVWKSLSTLEYLDLSSNHRIKDVPASVYSSPVLGWLRLIDLHGVTHLPDIARDALTNLISLDVRNSSIASLPSSFFDLPNLKLVFIEGTPLCSNGFVDSIPPGSNFALAMSQPNAGCVEQCSLHCNYEDRTYRFCYATLCNNTACNYQNSACL
jgi:Leucine-rich repeat (LRR) protein